MTKRQNAKYNMFLAVLQICNAKQTVWQVLVAFVNAMAQLNGDVVSLRDAFEEQETIITGYAEEKKATLDEMTAQAMVVKGAVQAYASDMNDQVLYNSVNFSPSKLKKGKASVSSSRAQIIQNAGATNLANLASYGVTSQMLTDLQTEIDTFNNLIAQPRDAKSAIAVATANVKLLVKSVDVVLSTKMDKLMENFKVSDPDFYAQYFNDRKIIDPTRTTAFRLWVLNQFGHPVTEGEVFVLGTPLSGSLNIKGFSMIGTIPFGTHSISLAVPSGTYTYGPFIFEKGKSLTKHVVISVPSTATPAVGVPVTASTASNQ